jgi:hypothetical protein
VVRAWHDETGKGRLGCLFFLLLVVFILYNSKDFGTVYMRYYRMKDEVKTQTTFAPGLSDAAIRDRLVLRADSLDVPIGPKGWAIRRTRNPGEITIRGEYNDSVVIDLLAYHKVFRFHFVPSARAPL